MSSTVADGARSLADLEVAWAKSTKILESFSARFVRKSLVTNQPDTEAALSQVDGGHASYASEPPRYGPSTEAPFAQGTLPSNAARIGGQGT